MGIMTRMGTPVLNKLAEGVEFVSCQHSLGRPLPLKGTYLKAGNKLHYVLEEVFEKYLGFGFFGFFPPTLLQLPWSTLGPATQTRC